MNKVKTLAEITLSYLQVSTDNSIDHDERRISYGKALGILEALAIMAEEEKEYPKLKITGTIGKTEWKQ